VFTSSPTACEGNITCRNAERHSNRRRPSRTAYGPVDRLAKILPRRNFYGRGTGVGRGLTDGATLGVGVGLTVAVGDGDAVTVGLGVAVAVAVAVAVGLAVAVAVAVAVGVAVGVGVGVPPPTAAKMSTRPQPYTLFGGPAPPH
jgi:hypothetical protein